MAMVDPMLEAARAHTREPEEVDWEHWCKDAQKAADHWLEKSENLMTALAQKKEQVAYLQDDIDRLKDVIQRLEQRCKWHNHPQDIRGHD